jgi:hypothetical protein
VALSRQYDALYQRWIPCAPVAWSRVVAHYESGQNPANVTGAKRGLFQVGQGELALYNVKHAAAQFTWDDMNRAEPNAKVFGYLFCDLIVPRLVAAGARADWTDPEFRKLCYMAWNAGWSESRGVPDVVRWLVDAGRPVTHANVRDFAAAAGAAATLRDQEKYAYQERLDLAYEAEASSKAAAPTPRQKGGTLWTLAVLLMLTELLDG